MYDGVMVVGAAAHPPGGAVGRVLRVDVVPDEHHREWTCSPFKRVEGQHLFIESSPFADFREKLNSRVGCLLLRGGDCTDRMRESLLES